MSHLAEKSSHTFNDYCTDCRVTGDFESCRASIIGCKVANGNLWDHLPTGLAVWQLDFRSLTYRSARSAADEGRGIPNRYRKAVTVAVALGSMRPNQKKLEKAAVDGQTSGEAMAAQVFEGLCFYVDPKLKRSVSTLHVSRLEVVFLCSW